MVLGVYEADCEKNVWKFVLPKQPTFRQLRNANIEQVPSASSKPVSNLRQFGFGFAAFESIVKHFQCKAVHNEQS
jgi:hypothetical protein